MYLDNAIPKSEEPALSTVSAKPLSRPETNFWGTGLIAAVVWVAAASLTLIMADIDDFDRTALLGWIERESPARWPRSSPSGLVWPAVPPARSAAPARG